MNKLVLVAALAVLASNADAVTVIVPDHRPTIQSAISGGADSVLVRGGYYPERLEIRRSVTIVQYLGPTGYGYSDVALPRVRGLTITESHITPTVVIRGVRFLGGVLLNRPDSPGMYLTFESCRMDSGLFEAGHGRIGYTGISMLNVQGCTILRGAKVAPYAANFTLNTFIGGGLDLFGEGFSTIKGNFVQGPAEVGIRSRGESARVEDNAVVGTVLGIDAAWHSGHASRNEVMDCSGTGIRAFSSSSLTENVIRRCGGYGMHLGGTFTATQNLIEDTGAAGIALIRSDYPSVGTSVIQNVIARCAGPGILAEIGFTATGNTCYLNQGSGIVTQSGGALSRNIAFSNGGAGLEWSQYEPQLECNDWFGNARGAVQGMARTDGPGPTDLAVDPLFCDVNVGDVHLRADSPLLDAAGCGLIGALGVGCGVRPALALESEDSHSREFGVRLRGRVALVTLDEQGPAALEVLDVAGRRLSRILVTGSREVALDQPAGVYFLRLTQGARSASAKAVVMP